MGQLTILKLRDDAKAQLGDKFDLKAFHDEVLNGGAMPLGLLQERLQAWIKQETLAAKDAPKDNRAVTSSSATTK